MFKFATLFFPTNHTYSDSLAFVTFFYKEQSECESIRWFLIYTKKIMKKLRKSTIQNLIRRDGSSSLDLLKYLRNIPSKSVASGSGGRGLGRAGSSQLSNKCL